MADKVSRIYNSFRGVDFRGDEVNFSRSPDSLNVWKDYKETESIRTRPGLELVEKFSEPVYSVSFFNGDMFVHSGKNIYLCKQGFDPLCLTQDGIAERVSQAFVFSNTFYLKDGNDYWVYTDLGFSSVVGYVPTTSIGRRPAGGGTQYEDVNMLSDYRKNTFLADGIASSYYLDTQSIDADYVPEVIVDDAVIKQSEYEVDYEKGIITFLYFAPGPGIGGRDNVMITFKKHIPEYRENILKCQLLQVFDNRVFFSGNPEKPNVVWHCSLDKPNYCSDTDYYYEGVDAANIRGLVAGNNALWVFREPSSANTTVFYHTPAIDDDYGKIYPAAHSSVSIGCIGRAINFNDDIVFFSERGMEGISGDITTEQVVDHRSSLVDRKLIAQSRYRDMVLQEWNGYLCVFIGNKVFLADSRSVFTFDDHIEYEWFYWELDKEVLCACVENGILYVGTTAGIYSFTDNEKYLESYWVTPKDKFKQPHRLKTTNKRGCVGEAMGDIVVYAKVEDTDFEHIGTFENVMDYFVCRIKRKKFKDIQLKFYSTTRFCLESVTLEAYVGGYIKR